MGNLIKAQKSHRQLTDKELVMMEMITDAGHDLKSLLDEVTAIPGVDLRWIAISQSSLQQGLMALKRAIAKPDFF